MKLTPIDIQQQQFRRELRGFDRREVQAFLDLVAQQLGDGQRETNNLRTEVRCSRRELDEHRERETTLREAMLTAQRAIEEIREQAQREAQLVITEAEMRAEKLVHSAHNRVTKILEEIQDLRRQRVRMIEELRGIVQTHVQLLKIHEQDERDVPVEGTVTVLDRLRAPTPPTRDEVGRVDQSG